MDFVKSISFLMIILLCMKFANAQQPIQGGCIRTTLGGAICSPPAGGIAVTSIGQILCGPGQCMTTTLGDVVCSSQPGGYIAVNSIGQILCTGGCVNASAGYCQVPR